MGIENTNRQYPLSAFVPFTYADLVAGNNVAAEVPSDAVVVGGEIVITTPFDSTTNTITVGDTDTSDLYESSVDAKAAARSPLVPTGKQYGQNGQIVLNYASTGPAATAGAGFLHVMYVREGRSNENQG